MGGGRGGGARDRRGAGSAVGSAKVAIINMSKHGLADPISVGTAKLGEKGGYRVGMRVIPLGGKAEGVVGGGGLVALAGGLGKVSIKQGQGILEPAGADKV